MLKFKQFIKEAKLLDGIAKGTKWTNHLDAIHSTHYLKGTNFKRVTSVGDDHTIYHQAAKLGSGSTRHTYTTRHNKTGKINSVLRGSKNSAGVFHVDTAESNGEGPKMHDVYHSILKSGHVPAIMGTDHSEGGQKIWQRLAKKPGVVVHGWDGADGDESKEHAVDVDTDDPKETHASERDIYGSQKNMNHKIKILNMPLVASYISKAKERHLLKTMGSK